MRMQNRFAGAGGVMALKRGLGTKELRECRNAMMKRYGELWARGSGMTSATARTRYGLRSIAVERDADSPSSLNSPLAAVACGRPSFSAALPAPDTCCAVGETITRIGRRLAAANDVDTPPCR